jgi:MoaA/NifB/PqqE/SkfB family radical SAM enzyme
MNQGTGLLTKQEAMRAAQPLSAYLELTYCCNWGCVFCYNPRHIDRRPLDVREWEPVLDDLRTLGTLTVTFTGGEPLCHPDFLAIARAARARSFAVRVFTNGELVDESMAMELAGLYPQAVELSLHGATAATHDAATARPGSFDAVWRAVNHLRQRGARVLVKCLLTRLNERELEQMIEMAASNGLPFHVDPTVSARDDGDTSPLSYSASRAALERFASRPEIASRLGPLRRDQGVAICGLGRLTLAIDPEGNVFPCMQWRRRALGNVRLMRLAKMWPSSPERLGAAQVAVDASAAVIAAGAPVSEYPFCPAIAMQRTGDPLVPDDETVERAFAFARVRRGTAL